MTSNEAAHHFKEGELDFVYIDGNHSYEADRFLTLYKEGLTGYTYLLKSTLE